MQTRNVGWTTTLRVRSAIFSGGRVQDFMADDTGNGTASNAIWAVALIIIVAMVVGVVYYSGILRGGAEKKVDINVSAPSR